MPAVWTYESGCHRFETCTAYHFLKVRGPCILNKEQGLFYFGQRIANQGFLLSLLLSSPDVWQGPCHQSGWRRLSLRGLAGLSYVSALKEDDRQGDQSQREPGEDRSVTPVHSRE